MDSAVNRSKPRGWRRWAGGTFVALGVTLVAVLGLRLAFFRGPIRSVEDVPADPVVDLHVHTAGIGAGNSGCRVSKELRNSRKFGIYIQAFGTTLAEVEREGDAILIRRIAEQVSASRHVQAAVVLAMDGVVDAQGNFDEARTEVLVPNEFVAREVARYPNLRFGASIHPYRTNALEQLDWAAQHGAVLVKWIPSIMLIDPADPRLVPFYTRMRDLGLPLLTHAGQERSFTWADDTLADPVRLRLPLSLGVTVIAAHIASTGSNEGEPDLERLVRMMREYPNLYSEISSLTQINRHGYLDEALKRPEFAGRLCYGSDFPLVNTALVSPWYFPLQLTQAEMRELSAITNVWDRDVRLKQALGVPADVFRRSAQVLRPVPAKNRTRDE